MCVWVRVCGRVARVGGGGGVDTHYIIMGRDMLIKEVLFSLCQERGCISL